MTWWSSDGRWLISQIWEDWKSMKWIKQHLFWREEENISNALYRKTPHTRTHSSELKEQFPTNSNHCMSHKSLEFQKRCARSVCAGDLLRLRATDALSLCVSDLHKIICGECGTFPCSCEMTWRPVDVIYEQYTHFPSQTRTSETQPQSRFLLEVISVSSSHTLHVTFISFWP